MTMPFLTSPNQFVEAATANGDASVIQKTTITTAGAGSLDILAFSVCACTGNLAVLTSAGQAYQFYPEEVAEDIPNLYSADDASNGAEFDAKTAEILRNLRASLGDR